MDILGGEPAESGGKASLGPGTPRDLLISTFDHLQKSVLANEQLGERRFQIYLTVMGAAGVVLGLIGDSLLNQNGEGRFGVLLSAGTACVLVFAVGILSILRVAKRDVDTTDMQNWLATLRRQAVKELPSLQGLLPWTSKPKQRTWQPGRGGIAFTLVLMNSVVGALAPLCFGLGIEAPLVVSLSAASVVAILLYGGQRELVKRAYRGQSKAVSPDQYFRAGAGVVLARSDGNVLALERLDIPGAWQLPQGGLNEGEEPLEAGLRELREETGIRPELVTVEDSTVDWLAYELPAELRSDKTGRGQAHRWFLLRAKRDDLQIHLKSEQQEFAAYAWMGMAELVKEAVFFRRPVYEQILKRFGPILLSGNQISERDSDSR